MNIVHNLVLSHLPIKRRISNKGWITCDAVCCHHRGHRHDTRSRGNILFAVEGSIVYNCYNCGFKTIFNGVSLSKPFEQFMSWLNISSESINRIKLELLQHRIDGTSEEASKPELKLSYEFKEVKLPYKSKLIEELVINGFESDHLTDALMYLSDRGNPIASGWNYYICDDCTTNKLKDIDKRIIIPFYYKNKVVGWSGRYIGKPPGTTPKYYNSDIQPGYLFNCDVLHKFGRKFVTVHEGPFDAISIDGVGVLGSELSREQIEWLKSTDAEKIIVPDRQSKNQGLIDAALENGWSVTFPEWEEDIKDSADASKRYGKLFTLNSVIQSRTNNALEIGIKRKMFRS